MSRGHPEHETEQGEAGFLEAYRARRDKYPKAANTADVALFTDAPDGPALLLVRRGGHPFRGRWALPGGFLDVGEGDSGQGEDLETCARRELAEETGIRVEPGRLEQLGTYGDPGRDPRGRTISTVYVGHGSGWDEPAAADDAAEARWVAVAELEGPGGPELAFDHGGIVTDAIGWARRRGLIDWASQARQRKGPPPL
ncbi:MAG TPA: NUDIX hydrolase [Acidimicrobiales bacterium]|nr:NUDIX hydrolase [Acidimicrobiales bacterium]